MVEPGTPGLGRAVENALANLQFDEPQQQIGPNNGEQQQQVGNIQEVEAAMIQGQKMADELNDEDGERTFIGEGHQQNGNEEMEVQINVRGADGGNLRNIERRMLKSLKIKIHIEFLRQYLYNFLFKNLNLCN